KAEFKGEIEPLIAQFDSKILGQFTAGGKLFGLPSDLSTLVVIYRTDIFRKLGLSPPRTWSEMNHVIGTLEANGYRYYFGFTNNVHWAINLYTIPYGLPEMEYGSDGKPKVNWTNPQF